MFIFAMHDYPIKNIRQVFVIEMTLFHGKYLPNYFFFSLSAENKQIKAQEHLNKITLEFIAAVHKVILLCHRSVHKTLITLKKHFSNLYIFFLFLS